TNRDITRAMARVVGRRAFLRVPAAALRLALGEAASMVLASQRAYPRRLVELGFVHRFGDLDDALRDALLGGAPDIGPAATVPQPTYLRERGARRLLRQTLVCDATLDEVFTFFTDATNLAALTPPGMGFRIESPTPIDMQEGTTIDYTVRVGG